jgi:ABC-type methionine transport system permease subunit
MRVNWKEVCKFLAGAFFVNAGILFYLYLTNTAVPVLGTHFVVQPAVNGLRSIPHFVFFLICFYIGFIRK